MISNKIKRGFSLVELLIYIGLSIILLSLTVTFYFDTKKNIDDSLIQQNITSNINLNYNKKTNIYLYSSSIPSVNYIDLKNIYLIEGCNSENCLLFHIKSYLNSNYTDSYDIKDVILSKSVFNDTYIYRYLVTIGISSRDIKTDDDKFYQTLVIEELRDISDNSLIDSKYQQVNAGIFLNGKIKSGLYQLKIKITGGKIFYLYFVSNIQDKNNFY